MGRVLVINFKNYTEIAGENSLVLSRTAEKVSKETGVRIIVCPPHPLLHYIASMVTIEVFSQSVEDSEIGRSTGHVIPEMLKESKVAGCLVNHSESRVSSRKARKIIERARGSGLKVCYCIQSYRQSYLCSLSPDFIAIEPPELIGTGMSVSRYKSEEITVTRDLLKRKSFGGIFLCGAGITSSEDTKKAIELGADGVIVSSAVVRSKNWESKIREIADAML